MKRSEISFLSSINNESQSFKEFFLMVDALIPLEWKVEVTFLKQLYCCGAEKSCPLPKWTGDFNGVATEESFEKTKKGIYFSLDYFENVLVRDDLFLIKNNFPLIYDFYKDYSSSLGIGSLDNNGLIRQTNIILNDMNFKYINSIKLGPEFMSSLLAARAARTSIQQLIEKISINSILIAEPFDLSSMNIINDIIKIGKEASIPTTLVSKEQLAKERELDDGTAMDEEYELYEDHSLFLVQDNFFLNKYDHIGCGHGSMYSVINNVEPYEFISSMINRKILKYKEYSKKVSGRLKDYFEYVYDNIHVNDNYTFIPSFMISDDNKFYNSLVYKNYFTKTKIGLLKNNTKSIKPIIEFNK